MRFYSVNHDTSLSWLFYRPQQNQIPLQLHVGLGAERVDEMQILRRPKRSKMLFRIKPEVTGVKSFLLRPRENPERGIIERPHARQRRIIGIHVMCWNFLVSIRAPRQHKDNHRP